MAISFFISTVPRGQARARHAVVAGHARTYKSKEQALYENTLQSLMLQYVPKKPMLGALHLSLVVVVPIPASKSKKWKLEAESNMIFPTTKPDLSNIIKGIEDVMQSMLFFMDDRQIVRLDSSKIYGDKPGYSIKLSEL
jgi:Holliday junction resolvase RusA-like endonuclease